MNKTIYKRWMAHILPYNKGSPIANNNWVRWIHNATGIFHCFDCIKLHNCWFSENNHPDCPLHENCHCHLESIPYSQVLVESKADSDFNKFDPYLFNRDNKYSHGKEKLFAQWGYTIEDAKWLQAEIEKQGRNKYISGDYTLGKLDLWGQRINIRIELQRRDTNDTISFNTGWMLKPDGKIVLNTPYGGK